MNFRCSAYLSRFIVALVFLVAHTSLLCGQEVSVLAAVDSTHITMGDWLHLTVQVKHGGADVISWGGWKDSIGVFEIIHQDSVQRDESGGVITEKLKFTLSKYDSGEFVIPSIGIAYKATGDTALRHAQSDPLTIHVSSVQVDTSKAIKDIKPPLDVPLTWKEISVYTGIIAAIAAVLYAIYYYVKKRKKPEEAQAAEEAKIPPHIQAIARLKELEEKRLWQHGDVKAFYSKATEIVREYFERRFGIMALEMTSDEVFAQLKRFALEADTMKTIESFFIDADLVKFAKYIPIPTENEAVIPKGLKIVERTKPVEEVPHDV
jgi:hypothetical protein